MNRNCTHTGRRLGTASLAAAVALALSTLGGCGVHLPPAVPGAPAAPETTLGATPAAPPATSPAPAPGATEAPSQPTPRATTPAAKPTASAPAQVTFTSQAIAGHKLGSSEAGVIATLTQLLGKPTAAHKGPSCEIFTDSPYASWYTFGPLIVSFEAKNSKSSSPRTLVSFGIQLSAASNPRFAIGQELPIAATFAQLKQRYPKGRTYDGPGSPPDSKFFELPGGNVTFSGGNKAKKPDYVQIGPVAFCE